MGTSHRVEQTADDKSVLLMSLRQQQSAVKEGSLAWHEIQHQINEVIAQRYLESLNR